MIENSGGGWLDALTPLAPLAFLLLLIVAIVLLRRKRRQTHQAPTKANPSEPQVFRAIPTDRPHLDAEPDSAMPELEAPHAPERAVDWARRIAEAEAAADHTALAEAHLAKARADLARGNAEQAAEHLRTSLRAAIKSKNVFVQAEARLDLADLARASGDLTTACEHWQIARSLFHKLSNAPRRDEAEHQMLKHGCPTDWVLTDF